MHRRFEKASITQVVTSCESFPCVPAGFILIWEIINGSVVRHLGLFENQIFLISSFPNPRNSYCSPSLSIAISRRFQPLFLTFLVALDSLRLALPIDTSLEARSNEFENQIFLISSFPNPRNSYCSPSLSIAISRRFQPLFLTFLVALDSLRLALPIDTILEARSSKLRNPVGPAHS
ncbi:isoamylase 2, chloroplastic-like [Dorcoceras hygrometricum]|uniref:Isoamylase 2, chloroplastic-like n=1 Tax=Dorcoceras hygrometricum TaxID=472368 RepID=A0A2Z7C3F7_9LAMI|nr:isoamylase 2, chloroplastic-like [Dorcoceras hygrometricum]